MPPPLVILSGPTAIGKSPLAYQLCEIFPFEIISVDSAQVYRQMNIGTAKADNATLAKYPQHLINIINPDQSYSAAAFCQDTLQLIATIHQRGKIPLLVGGTMLYLNSLINGISDLPTANPEIRGQIEKQAEAEGWQACYQQLCTIDPLSAAKINPADRQRIQRALEVYLSSGKPMSAYFHQARNALTVPHLHLALLPQDRQALHQRINQRFKNMLDGGLIAELEEILRLYPSLNSDSTSMRSVGYRQALEYLSGEITLLRLYEKGSAATRQLAKRQLTWLNNSLANTTIICDINGDYYKIFILLKEQIENFLTKHKFPS